MGCVFVCRYCTTLCLFCAKTFITYITQYKNIQVFERPAYLGLVFFTDISFHKAGTNLKPCASLFLRLSPIPKPASFKIRKMAFQETPSIFKWYNVVLMRFVFTDSVAPPYQAARPTVRLPVSRVVQAEVLALRLPARPPASVFRDLEPVLEPPAVLQTARVSLRL